MARSLFIPLTWACALWAAALGGAWSEDTIYLKDGTERKGDVVEKSETVIRVRTDDGVVSIPRSSIDSIVSDGKPPKAPPEQKVEQKAEPKEPERAAEAKPPEGPKAARKRSVPCHDYDAEVKELAGRRHFRKHGDEAAAAFEKVLQAYREKGGPAGHGGADENWEWYLLMGQLLCECAVEPALPEDKHARDAKVALGYLDKGASLYYEQGPEGDEANETKGRICFLQAGAYKALGDDVQHREKLTTAAKTYKYAPAEEELKKLGEGK